MEVVSGRAGLVQLVSASSSSHQVLGSKPSLYIISAGVRLCFGYSLLQTPLVWDPLALGLPFLWKLCQIHCWFFSCFSCNTRMWYFTFYSENWRDVWETWNCISELLPQGAFEESGTQNTVQGPPSLLLFLFVVVLYHVCFWFINQVAKRMVRLRRLELPLVRDAPTIIFGADMVQGVGFEHIAHAASVCISSS
jgi:hypothetical protein